jgi:hypothetical protein
MDLSYFQVANKSRETPNYEESTRIISVVWGVDDKRVGQIKKISGGFASF